MTYLGPTVGHIKLDSWSDVEVAAGDELLVESQWCELKKQLIPGAPGNVELAKDLAALSVLGGQLIIGVVDKTFEVVGCEKAEALHTRIAQVASSRIDPPLSPIIRLLHNDDKSRAVIVVAVPPSAQAPHQAHGCYWGRSSEGKRVLSDVEVRALMARQASSEEEFEQRLLSMVKNDPLADVIKDHPTGHGHIFLHAEPCTPIPGRSTPNLAAVAASVSIPDRGRGTPSTAYSSCRDTLGVAVTSYSTSPRARSMYHRSGEHALCYLLCSEKDGSLSFFGGGGTFSRESTDFERRGEVYEVVSTHAIVTSVIEFYKLVKELSCNHWGYAGQWRIGIHLNNLKGKYLQSEPFFIDESTFPRDTYTQQLIVTPASWAQDESVEAVALLAGFLRAIGCEGQSLQEVRANHP